MGISIIEEGRLDMRRIYSGGERTFFPGGQRPTQVDHDPLEKANYCSLQDKSVLCYFLWFCSVLLCPPKGQRVAGPWGLCLMRKGGLRMGWP